MEQLEQAIWAGKGLDDWVVDALRDASRLVGGEGWEEIEGTKAASAIQVRVFSPVQLHLWMEGKMDLLIAPAGQIAAFPVDAPRTGFRCVRTGNTSRLDEEREE